MLKFLLTFSGYFVIIVYVIKKQATTKGMIIMFKVKDGDVVKRNGNYFKVKKTKDGHTYLSLLLGQATITSYRRMSLAKINQYYEKVENYKGDEKKWL